MFYKTQYHEELYHQFVSKLNSNDLYYTWFAYVAAAIEKKELLKALDDCSIDVELLLDISKVWSNSERAMLEVAWQMFNNGNLYEEDSEILYPTIKSIFNSLDKNNSQIVIEAISMKHL
ncbi:hypothetical protein [Sporosarcina sp. FSL K6-1508]|uniref:hypothetical protein n=1 Tax=Sporosarcina sp. FSL K6-1508 TaxID=2921553 RepID=UPI0030F8DD5D